MRLRELLTADNFLNSNNGYLQLPQILRDKVDLLWADDWYDGPRSGMLHYLETRCWFEQCADELSEDVDDEDREFRVIQGRRYVVIALTRAQIAEEERLHELFRQRVGTHFDFDRDGMRHRSGVVRPKELWSEYYTAIQGCESSLIRFADNEALGWFEDSC